MEIQVTKTKTWVIGGKEKPVKPRAPFVAHLPSVNLLPASVTEYVERKKAERLVKLAIAGVAAAIIAGVAYAQIGISYENHKLDTAQANTAALAVQQTKLSPISTYYTTVDAGKTTISTQMANEVLFSNISSHLNAATPASISFTSVDFKANTTASPAPGVATAPAAAGSCPGADPFATNAVVGCINLSGTSRDRAALGQLIQRLGQDPLFVNPFIAAATSDQTTGKTTFTASVALSPKAFPKRYNDDRFILQGASK